MVDLEQIFKDFSKELASKNDLVLSLVSPDDRIIASSEKISKNQRFDFSTLNSSPTAIYRIVVYDVMYGYLVIKGKESSVALNEVGQLIADVFKTRIIIELDKAQLRTSKNIYDTLVGHILNNSNMPLMHQALKNASLKEDVTRVPIIIKLNSEVENSEFLKHIGEVVDDESFFSQYDSTTFILFIRIRRIQAGYEYDHIESMIHNLIENYPTDYFVAVGLPVDSLNEYFVSYSVTQWLIKHSIKTNYINYFKDNLLDYLLSSSSQFDFLKIYKSRFESQEFDLDEVTEVLDELIQADFNIAKASRTMFIHKNTLVYRIEKIEKVFGFNIRENFMNKVFVTIFIKWLQQVR